ncbi:Ataxin-1 and HBP1 module (AXH) [Tenacibaculum sp. MAR_2010_89]|nr:Ataxin-1 and HBP1 module (AXH) [Tenacibaculum sp. MAR_2010_89]
MLLCVLGYAQDFTPMKSPDVKAFLNANYLPVNESTGKASINIPIYNIDLDGLNIPISLSYDTGGVKVNSSSSKVGLNWNLNAGGFISKEIKGVSDIDISLKQSSSSGPGDTYTSYGYLRHLLTWNHPGTNTNIAEPYRDTQPDLFHVMAPGLFTKFTHKSNGEPFELDKSETRIESPFNNPSYLHNMYWRHQLKPGFAFKMTSNKGFEYSFDEVELNAQTPKLHGNAPIRGTMYAYGGENDPLAEQPIDIWYYKAIPNNLVEPLLSLNTTEKEIENGFFSYGIYYQPKGFISDLYPTTHLTSIKSPISKRKVTFHYSNNYIVDNDRRIERSYEGTKKTGQVNYEHDFTREKILNKIIFPQGQIHFYYSSNRLDVRGGKILKKIEIRNKKGVFVKGIIFEQDYFNSLENCNENHCKRLRLNAIKFLDKENNVLPGYSFEYNATKLPKRFSVEQDFTGFYNGQSGFSEELYIPKIYFKDNQGKNSYLPFPSSGYSLISGNASLLPNLNYSKSAVLEKIIYPTGGYSTFDYELHSFKFLNEIEESGGVRIKSQSIFDSNNILERKISYDYILENGSTSGSINNLPHFYLYNYSLTGGSTKIKQVSNTKLQLTQNSYVNYSRVKISEQNNGYIINEYSSSSNYPNEYPSTYTLPNSVVNQQNLNVFKSKLNTGLNPDIYRNYSIKRGQLLSSRIYDKQNTVLKSIVNEYQYKPYDLFTVSENVIFGHANFNFTNGNNARYAKFDINLAAEANSLKKSTTKEYTSNGVISNEKTYIYHSSKNLLKETQSEISDGSVIKEKYSYPFDSDVSSMPNVSDLESLNILQPIKTTILKNSSVIGTTLTEYENYGNNKILPKKTKTSKDNNSLEVENEFHKYDERGNLIELSKKDGTHITVLWGHNYQSKIAEIIGATYQEVLTALSMSTIDNLQNLSDNELTIVIDNLRNNLQDAQIHSYTITPLIGVTKITKPNGNKTYYTYDSFNRLETIKDNNNKILNKISYNYQLKPAVSNILQEPLALNIIKKPTDFYVPSASASNHKILLYAEVSGGKGNYRYEWSTTSSSSSILSRSSNYIAPLACGESISLKLKVTDDDNVQIIRTVVVNAAECGEPFYVGQIEGTATANNQNNFWINAEGGSYNFTYQWFIPGGPILPDTWSYDKLYPKTSPLLKNTSGSPVIVNLNVKVKDEESGLHVIRSRTVTIQPEFEINSCFIVGTKITMANGKQKNIENVIKGDKVLTYNLKTKEIEIGEVKKTVSPEHTKFVLFKFENGIENTNTLDHPYYVKGKGWSSYDPKMTQIKYGLKVNKIKIGDVVLSYKQRTKKVVELKLVNQQLISELQKTYNLDKVSKNHNFFANSILVHNKSFLSKKINTPNKN